MQEHMAEYRYLEEIYENGGHQITIVYGMNQVGKSYLLKKFALFHEGIFFLSKPGSSKEIKRNFAKHVGIKISKNGEVPGYEEIFAFAFAETEKKHVIIIDDFHNLIKNDETFLPILIKYINEHLKNCFVYFVSSNIGWVENQMISKIGSYASSITGFLKMQEMSFEECCSYFKTYSTYDSLVMYSILGGQHGYIACCDSENTMVDNICKKILSTHSYVFSRMNQYIEEQLRETSVYYTILEALAKGNCKLNEMYHYTGFSRAKISVYLKTLMELEFVEKVFSIDTPGRMNLQKGVYRISNPLLFFYFKFIYPNESNYVLMEKNQFYRTYISEELKIVVANRFAVICRSMFFNMNENKDLPFFCSSVGEWVGKKGTIPIVACNEEKQYLVGFCNDSEEQFSLEKYEKQKYLLNEAKIEVEYTYLFSLHGYNEKLLEFAEMNNSLILIDME